MARPTTCIRNAAWIAAWDEGAARHVYQRHADIAFAGDRIVHVGPGYAGPVEREIDGRQLLVMPGLVDSHTHPTSEPGYVGIREEHGVPTLGMTGLYERMMVFQLDEAGHRAAAEVAYAEMLASGVTSVADLSDPFEGWLDLLAESGLRGFVAAGYNSATWYVENDYQLHFRWREDLGRSRFEAALKVLDAAAAHPSGRLSGIVYPAQIDTCTEELLRESIAVAAERDLPLTTHAAQTIVEFRLMVERHGKSPLQWAADIGLLGPRTILGHAFYLDEHSWVRWPTRRDLDLLAESGTSVAHCPTVFARYGAVLEDFGRYRRAGVNIGLGTDSSPHNLIEEIRSATVMARVAARDIRATTAGEAFHAATVGGAKALGRRDIGHLAPGMKADLVLVDLESPWMQPVRDPLRSLVYTAADRAVRDVFVDGRQVVEGGQVLTIDRLDALGRLTESYQRMLSEVPRRDYAGRTVDEIAPLTLSVV